MSYNHIKQQFSWEQTLLSFKQNVTRPQSHVVYGNISTFPIKCIPKSCNYGMNLYLWLKIANCGVNVKMKLLSSKSFYLYVCPLWHFWRSRSFQFNEYASSAIGIRAWYSSPRAIALGKSCRWTEVLLNSARSLLHMSYIHVSTNVILSIRLAVMMVRMNVATRSWTTIPNVLLYPVDHSHMLHVMRTMYAI